MDNRAAKEQMEQAGVEFAPGLTLAQLRAAEQRWRFEFPPDLAELLSFALPISGGWYDWRDPDNAAIVSAMQWPLEGMRFDIENNTFWPREWGERPSTIDAAFEIAATQVSHAPPLVPLCGHRYMPTEPHERDNPVFSVYQTDIIYYGANLWEYLSNEYSYFFRGPGSEFEISSPIKPIRFWSWLVDLNNGAV